MQKQLISEPSPALWYITWESPRELGGGLDKPRSAFAPQGRAGNGVPASQPTQPVATRPLAIQLNGTWYTYGWDLTKNICEVYGQHGYIRTAYTYTPYGQVTAEGDVEQAIQWSSEFNDTELGLVYYNYRHYNPADGRWLSIERGIDKTLLNPYSYVFCPISQWDVLGDELKIMNHVEPKKVARLTWGGYMSAHFNVVVEREPMLFWQRLIFRGGLKISSEYVEDSDGYNKKHEEYHIKITLKRWNQLVEEIQFMDGTIYRCKNSALAEAYATSAIKLYDSLAKIENARFDVNEYEYMGRTKGGYIEQALNRFNEESSKIRDKLETYQKNRKRYYKVVENKKVKNKQIRIPESVYINDYKTPIK